MGFFKGFHGGLMNRKNVECILFQPNMVVSGSTVIMIFGEGFHHSTNGVFCLHIYFIISILGCYGYFRAVVCNWSSMKITCLTIDNYKFKTC